MAEAEVTLKYKSLPARLTCIGLTAALPISIVFLVWSLLVISMAVMEGNIHAGPAALLAFGEMSFVAMMALGAFVTSDHTLFITRQGISVPFWMCPVFGIRSQHNWTAIRGVLFNDNVLTLLFAKSFPLRISMDRLNGTEAQQILVALDVWAGGSGKFQALEDAKAQMHLIGADHDKGYTELWEEELTRRFGATNFIPLEPDCIIGSARFTVERQLAFGGFSAIYLVRDENNSPFVLKEAVVPEDAEQALHDEAIRLFDREAKLLSSIDHEQIAHVYDSFVERGRHYLLIEYIPGLDLRKLVREAGPLPQSRVVQLGIQIAEIIDYLHQQPIPIVHRDIAPDNLIVSDAKIIHLIDFGAANLFLGTATGTMIGKQAYMATEQLRGKATTKSDIYGFGCTLHFLLTGKDPEALTVSRPSSVVTDINPQLDDLVARCTALEPEDRPESASHVAAELKSLRTLVQSR